MQSNPRGREADVSIVEMVPALRAFARTFCKNPTDADDLVQDTLLKALKSFDQFEPGTRMKSWLFTIMRNTFYTKIKVYMREAPAAAECVANRPSVEPTQEWSVRGREVREAINRLPEHQREVLVLIGVLGVSYEDAAEICGCAVGTIKSRLNRARLSVLTLLAEESTGSLVESAGHFTADEYETDQR